MTPKNFLGQKFVVHNCCIANFLYILGIEMRHYTKGERFFFVSECLKFFWAFFFFREVDFRLSEVRNKGKILEGRIDIEKNTIAIE